MCTEIGEGKILQRGFTNVDVLSLEFYTQREMYTWYLYTFLYLFSLKIVPQCVTRFRLYHTYIRYPYYDSYPDEFMNLPLFARCALSEVIETTHPHLYLALNTVQTRNLFFFSALKIRVFQLQNEHQWTSWET